MKKILLITLFIFMILTNFLSINYAVTITEEDLENALNNTKHSDSEIFMDKTNKKIKITTPDSENTVNYDLSSEPTFTVETTIDNLTTYEQWIDKQSQLIFPITLYVPISSINGVSEEDSMLYITSKIILETTKYTSSLSYKIEETNNTVKITDKNGNNIPVSDFPKYALEITKEYYNTDIVVTDSNSANTFNFITKIKESSENSCTLQTVLTINSNGDFSKISGYAADKMNEISNSVISSAQNAVNKHYNNLANEQENVNKITNNLNKLPQTGNFFEQKDGLTLICIVSSILLIAIILKDIKYKNINKK